MVKANKQPLDSKAILEVIKAATSEDDLKEKLIDMIGQNLADSEFTDFIETALKVADIHGFSDEHNGD